MLPWITRTIVKSGRHFLDYFDPPWSRGPSGSHFLPPCQGDITLVNIARSDTLRCSTKKRQKEHLIPDTHITTQVSQQ